MTLFNNFCAAILAVASACRTAIKDAARIIFGFFAAGTNAAVEFLPTIRRMKSATAFLAVAVAIPLMSACGSSSGISVTPSNTLAETIAQVEDDLENEEVLISQPLASSTGADFRTAGGTGSNLVFPVDSALIRSASGNDYAYLYQQNAITIAEVLAIGPYVVSTEFTWTDLSVGSAGCRQRNAADMVSCSAGVYTFSVGDSISPNARFGGNDDATSTHIEDVVAAGNTGNIGQLDGTPARTIPATVHVSEFDTEGTNTTVAAVVSVLQTVVNASVVDTGFASATVTIAVKGARDISVTYLNVTTGVNEPRVVDGYFFETQYSALAWWIERPDLFLSNGNWTFDTRLLHFGLQTPAAGARTGTVTYSGIAAGGYLRNGGTVVADRFVVGGQVNLIADFLDAGGISGTAELEAYNVADLATSRGMVTVLLNDNSGSDSNIDGADFSDTATIMDTPTVGEAFADLDGGAGTFEGYFTGPGAEEAVGRVIVVTDGADDDANTLADNDFLEFGFLTREE